MDSRISEASAKELICFEFDTTKRNILIWPDKKAVVLDITCKLGKLILKFSKDCVRELVCKNPEEREKLIRDGKDPQFGVVMKLRLLATKQDPEIIIPLHRVSTEVPERSHCWGFRLFTEDNKSETTSTVSMTLTRAKAYMKRWLAKHPEFVKAELLGII